MSPRVRVALNLVFLVPGESAGLETYARELIPRLKAVDGLELHGLVSRGGATQTHEPWVAEIPHEVVPVDASNRLEWVRGEQQHVPRMARRAGADVVHSLANTAPLWGRFARVVTVHDVNFAHVPAAHASGLLQRGSSVLVRAGVRRSDEVIVISDATRRDLMTHLGTPERKVHLVRHGVSGRIAEPAPEHEVRRRHDLGDRPVLLSVSAKRPHKNLPRLLEAFAQLAPERRPLLVIPGKPTPHEAELRAQADALGITGDVRFPAWVSAEDLEGLHDLCDFTIFPSLYEGWGAPVLEAMARGVAVACSTRGGLAEGAGDAALTFDAESVPAIRDAMERLVADPALREDLRRRGLERAAQFRWERCAEETAAVYRRALSAP